MELKRKPMGIKGIKIFFQKLQKHQLRVKMQCCCNNDNS